MRKINPEAARRAVLEYLKTNGHNISQSVSVFRINRPVIYDILRKERRLKGSIKGSSPSSPKDPTAISIMLDEVSVELDSWKGRGQDTPDLFLLAAF
jgi:hypothetical protein